MTVDIPKPSLPSLTSGTWHHLAFTASNSSTGTIVRSYFDGTPHAEGQFTQGFYTGNKGELRIGARTIAGSKVEPPFKGMIDEMKIFNRAFSDPEIQALYLSTIESGETIVKPNRGGNAGQVTVNIIGNAILQGATATLVAPGQPDIVGTNTGFVSEVLTTTFDLRQAAIGSHDLIVTNLDGSTIRLQNGFTIEQGGAPVAHIQKIGTPAVLGRKVSYYITVSNTGNIDGDTLDVVELLEPWFMFILSTPPPTTTTQLPDIFPPVAMPEWHLTSLPADGSQTISYSVLLDSSFTLGHTVRGTACTDYWNRRAQCDEGFKQLWMQRVTPVCQACAGQRWCAPCEIVIDSVHDWWVDCLKAQESPLLGGDCASFNWDARGSVDPNDLIGPSGEGPPKWISGAQPLQYVITFENLPTATKSATDVVIADNLDVTTLDLSTLALGPITFPNQVVTPSSIPLAFAPFTTTLDLRPANNLVLKINASVNTTGGVLTWTFQSLDPTTNKPPTDPLAGFLPPGAEGSVFFTVMPKAGIATGTIIQNQAMIVFDVNAPINTPTWLNTLDNTPAASHVLSLPSIETSASFNVTWTGSDVGSGIQDFTIYVSDKNGAFGPWQTNTTATSAMFNGVAGHTYSFFSIARDLTGNSEGIKTAVEASTAIAIPGDLNGDGKVDCADLAIVKASFGKKKGQAGFDPRADVNNDGVVDVRDLAFVSQKLPVGTKCP